MGEQSGVRIVLTSAQALVLHAWLADHSDEICGADDLGRAARSVAWDLEATLEKALPEVISPDYESILAGAVARVPHTDVP